MKLDIIYEDKSILALNKPAGLTVHPGAGRYGEATLAHGLLAYTRSLSSTGGWERPGIVHRLDRDTSGILLIAKNNKAHGSLARQFESRKVKKEYWALAWGTLDKKDVRVEALLGRHPGYRRKIAVVPSGRESLTTFALLRDHAFCCEVAAFPATGRTHQIRVHLQHIHHPVVGDTEYGGTEKYLGSVPPLFRLKAIQLLKMAPRQMLHARKIKFTHPATRKTMELEAAFPGDIQTMRTFLKNL